MGLAHRAYAHIHASNFICVACFRLFIGKVVNIFFVDTLLITGGFTHAL